MDEVHIPLRRRLRARIWSATSWAAAHAPVWVSGPPVRWAASIAAKRAPGQIARGNLERVYSKGEHTSAQLDNIQTRVFQHVARLTAESTRLAHTKPGALNTWIHANVSIDPSVQHLRDALAHGSGAIVATAHLGNWDLLAAALAMNGFEGSVVGRFRRSNPMANWFVQMRRNYGVHTFPQDSSPKEFLGTLKQGKLLGLLCDLEVKRLQGEFIPFLGSKALTMSAPASLARASRAPIVPMRCVLLPSSPNTYTLLAEPPIHFDRTLPPKQAKTTCLEKLNDIYSRWIYETPEQWAWYQARWRTTQEQYRALPLAERRRRDSASVE